MNVPNLNNLSVNRMYCIPTEHTYKDMYQRSFSLGAGPGHTEQMHNYFINQGVDRNAQLSMTSAAAEIGGIVRLAAVPTCKAGIPHGWSTQRLMYVLVIDEIINDSTTLSHYVQGYSEYYDPSYAGSLDPNATYYINSVTTVTRVRNMYTQQIDSRVTSTYNIIADPTGGVSYQEVDDTLGGLSLIRPSDIMTELHSNSLYSGLNDVSLNVKTSSISNGGNVSSKSNNDPLKYFTKTVNAVIMGKSIDTGFNTPEGVLSNASGVVAEQAITNNAFMRTLARLTGVLEPWTFSLNILTGVDPNINSKITLVNTGSLFRDATTVETSLDTNNTEAMLNYTAEAEIAQTFINSLTANMSENLVTMLSGTITNMNGAPITTISNINSFLEGVDITPYGNRIINYINGVIMPQLTINGMRLVDLVFECDLLGDTTISVSIERQPGVIYRMPTFADSLYSPVLSNQVAKDAVIGDFEVVVDTVMGMSPDNAIGAYTGY